ncbi:hypothetical protein AB6805_30380 [Chitinophaga sp. RCC_12]|uniref:hypothetical protein n=1 Tax=Chitinophaga sp. RCC_12 TaxID=3239226 RepID=UPI003524D33B
MKLENQVCSLEQAKILKELGVSQTSLLYYVGNCEKEASQNIQNSFGYDWSDHPCYEGMPIKYAAFTVAELGAMLPATHFSPYMIGVSPRVNSVCVTGNGPSEYWHTEINGNVFGAFSTEATGKSQLLIHCIENKFIGCSIEEINKRLQNS